jgi:formylglycine-generating enzyme required for sulfatase activity
MVKIFISYRRKDSQYVADSIHDHLSGHFGPQNVFLDVGSIPFGVDFRKYLAEQVAAHDVLLVLMGPEWGKLMQERAGQANDFVRLEIELALQQNKLVIPVMVMEAEMPDFSSLPKSIEDLQWRNSAEVRRKPHLEGDCKRLAAGIKDFFKEAPPPPKIEILPPRIDDLPLWTAAARAVLRDDLFEWCDVPAGPFLMGSERKNQKAANYDSEPYDDEPDLHQVTLRRFLIAKYPTTYEQFNAFLADTQARGNYDSWFVGLAADAEQRKMADQAFTHAANLPRERVNWYQSVAFTHWLSAGVADYLRARGLALPNGINDPNKPGSALIRLPTEAEWEKAARGTDGRIYPWGNSFDGARCNTDASGIKKTTPVTAYLQGGADGTSPYGAADMVGNVWEWCLNPWTKPYQHVEAEGGSMSDANSRLLRGGSWDDDTRNARVASRYDLNPHSRDNGRGGRCVAAIFILL